MEDIIIILKIIFTIHQLINCLLEQQRDVSLSKINFSINIEVYFKAHPRHLPNAKSIVGEIDAKKKHQKNTLANRIDHSFHLIQQKKQKGQKYTFLPLYI